LLILSGLEEQPNTCKATSKHGQESVDEETHPGNSTHALSSKGRNDISVALPKPNSYMCGYKVMWLQCHAILSPCTAHTGWDFMSWGLIPVLLAITVLLLALLLAVLQEPYIGKNCKSIALLVLLCGTSCNFETTILLCVCLIVQDNSIHLVCILPPADANKVSAPSKGIIVSVQLP